MTENKQTNTEQQYYYDDDEIDLLDLLIVLAKHKKLILGLTTLFAVLSIAYASWPHPSTGQPPRYFLPWQANRAWP